MAQARIALVGRHVSFGGVPKAELLERLVAAGVQLNAAGLDLFADERFYTSAHPATLHAFQVTPGDLGLRNGGVMTDIVAAAVDHGLSLCPLELGPHLRLAFRDQAEGAVGNAPSKHRAPPGSITVASAPLSDDDETPKGFYLRRIEGTLWLRGYRSWDGHIWAPDDVFVFASASSTAT